MELTNDQYDCYNKLQKWWNKYTHQIIDIAGCLGTGMNDIVNYFLESTELDRYDIAYLSYDQHQVFDMAYNGYHAYYIDRFIYKYTKIVDFSSLPIINSASDGIIRYHWEKDKKKHISDQYKLLVVFDSVLLTHKVLKDLSSFGVPIILLRDPMMVPAPNSYLYTREPNILLRELNPAYEKNPLVYFAYQILHGNRLRVGSYDIVSVIPKKNMNVYNLKSSDMNLVLTQEMMVETNDLYRRKILKRKDSTNLVGEKLIVMKSMHDHKIVNKDEKRVKIYMDKGLVGKITKMNRHVHRTKYVPIEFTPQFYNEPFTDISMDRHWLNRIEFPSRQIIPDNICYMDYAYALTIPLARTDHWNKVTFILDDNDFSNEVIKSLIYTGIAKTKKKLTLII